MDLPKRKNTRLPQYDYSTPGGYFVTICTKDKKHVLGTISVGQGLAPAEIRHTKFGAIAAEQLMLLSDRYDNLSVDKYVIMPNHIHILLVFSAKPAGASPCPTLSDVICAYKSLTTRACRLAGLQAPLFQRSFHDHIIRNDEDYRRIWQYIDTNAEKWAQDCYYTNEEL